jgi:uncharacterized OB-fold protein
MHEPSPHPLTVDTIDPLPVPPAVPNPEIMPHLEGLERGELVLPRCDACGFVIWFPRAFCPECGSTSVTWSVFDDRGTVYSFSVVRKGLGDYAESAPYLVAYVELECGPRVLTNIVGAVDDVVIGTAVRAVYSRQNGDVILRFARGA